MYGVAHIPPVPEPSLPKFSTREARFRKARDANSLIFFVPTRSSLLLPLLRPVNRAYKEQGARCLQLLQNVALIPSCKSKKLLATITQALKMPVSAGTRRHLETNLRPLMIRLRDEDEESGVRPLIALQLKERVAECLRHWIADPIEGFVLRKEHVVKGMRLDDLVVTPVGAGYLRGYRSTDSVCTIVYPWGYGFIHIKDVEKVQQVLDKHLKKRMYHEYVALKHYQLHEQIEGLLENLPPALNKSDVAKVGTGEDKEYGVEECEKLLQSLEEEHMNTTVLRKDLSFVRRIDAIAEKVKNFRRSQTVEEPDRKMLRIDENDEREGDAEQQDSDETMQIINREGEQEQEQEQEKEQRQKLQFIKTKSVKPTDRQL